MIRAIAKWWAKRSYIWRLEISAGTEDINASTAYRNAEEKRKLVAQLNAEADAIEKNIEAESAKLEKGFWECENGHDEPISTAFAGLELEISRTCSTCRKPMKIIRLDLMTGQEKYELEKQKKDAQSIAAEKRGLAKQEQENVDSAVQAIKMLSGRAQDSRNFADKIRAL